MMGKASVLIKNVKIGWGTSISLKVQHFTATETDQRNSIKKEGSFIMELFQIHNESEEAEHIHKKYHRIKIFDKEWRVISTHFVRRWYRL